MSAARATESVQAPALAGRAGANPGLATYALADGTVIALLDAGPPDAAHTIVLIHGWTQDHTSWEDVVDELLRTRPNLRVVAYDARGHGWSDAGPRGTATIDQAADDLADVLTGYLPNGDVVLAGHSLGGPVIMALAERHGDLLRERVTGVGFVATSAAGIGRDIFGLPARVIAPALLVAPVLTWARVHALGKINLHHPGLIAPAIRAGFYGPGAATKRNRMRTAKQTSRAHPATSAQLVDEMMRHDRSTKLDALGATVTVVLAGTRDGLCPMSHSRAIAAAMPHAELQVFAGAGHMLPFERPVEVARTLAGLVGSSREN